MKKVIELKHVGIHEMAKGDADDPLSLIDIKAAIAEQDIPVSELYSKQDLAANSVVVSLVVEAEQRTKQRLTKENVILKKDLVTLKDFKDKTDTVELIKGSKVLANKGSKVVAYIKARLSTGRGVDLSGDLTDEQRQEKVNEAIAEELTLIESQGIEFKTKKGDKEENAAKVFEDDGLPDNTDWTDPANNPLMQDADTKKDKND